MRDFFGSLKFYGIFDAVPLALAATVIYAVVRIINLKAGKHQRAGVPAEIARGLLVWYLMTLVVVVWFSELPRLVFGKITFAVFAESTFFWGEFANSGRFLSIFSGQFSFLRDAELLANIELFVPYGLLLPVAFRRLKWWAADLIALGTTLIIELIQPFVGRSFDVDDIIANTLGAVIGCGVAKLGIALASLIKKKRAER